MTNTWHLINDPSPRRGGAQRILDTAIQRNERILSQLDGGNSFYGRILKKYSWCVYILLAFFKEKPKSIFIHSRCFLPYTWLFRAFKTNVIFYGHAHYRSYPWTFRLFPCNLYIAVSQSVCSYFVALGVPEAKITTIRNPYMSGQYVGNSLEPCSTLKLSYIGGLHTWKGIDKALDLLFVYANKSTTNINLTVIGEGPLRELLEGKASKCPENLSIDFLGYQTAPYSKLLEAPIVLIPSLEEGFGLVAIEAIYQGKIAIHSNIPALTEVCQEDQLSFSFDINDSTSFENALNQATVNIKRLADKTLITKRTERIQREFGLNRFHTEQQLFRKRNLG